MIDNLVFYAGLAGLLAHELDAVHKRERHLLFVLRKMEETKARRWFIIAHIPLFVVLLWLIAHPNEVVIFRTMVIMDCFMIIHAGLHWRLSGHPKNEFNTLVSRVLIYGTAVVGAVHLLLTLNT